MGMHLHFNIKCLKYHEKVTLCQKNDIFQQINGIVSFMVFIIKIAVF